MIWKLIGYKQPDMIVWLLKIYDIKGTWLLGFNKKYGDILADSGQIIYHDGDMT